MSGDPERRERRIVTDQDRIRELAEVHGAVPVATHDGVDLQTEPEAARGDRITWAEFAERFDDGEVVVYRPGETDETPAGTFDVVDRSEHVEGPGDVGREAIATSDTGDDEPPAYEVTEGGLDEEGEGERSTAPTGDMTRGPGAADDLVLDEIHEYEPGLVGPEDEYVVFVNDGDDPIDVSGWTVENQAGRTYRFPDPTVVDPGGRLTLHSGPGADEESHRYWGADEPVWGGDRDTVTVRTADGEEVVREPYEA